jgi:dTMP kinase
VTRSTDGTGRGRFITIEGPDGSGKTTQAERLAAHLRSGGANVVLTREPGGTWLGERVRDLLLARRNAGETADPLTDAFLFDAARHQLVREVIEPALADGATVVCARFTDSTLAYQGFGAGVPLDVLRVLESVATGGLHPDLTVLLDLPAVAGLGRKRAGDVTRFEADFDLAFHERVRAGFLALAAAEPGRFVVVDATMALEAVTAAVVAAVATAGGGARPSEPDPSPLRNTP